MFKYLLLCTLTAQAIWCAPAVLGDVASHIVIVTPQAQVHLDPAGGPFIQHLTPLARFAAPHEETIVYVPASVAAPILQASSANAAAAADVGRSSGASEPQPPKPETKQIEQISTQIQQAIQQGSSMFGPQLSEAAAAAAAAAASAGSGFFPAFFPPPTANKDEKLKPEYETPASTKPLLAATAEARRYYAISPVVPHIVDIVHTPVFLSAIRARSLQEAEKPAEPSLIAALPLLEAVKPEALPLKEELKTELPKESAANAAELEKKTDFARFLEANALKEQIKPQPQQQLEELDLKRENLKPEPELPAALPQNLAIASELPLAQPDGAAAIAAPLKAIAADELPQSKVA